jgi:hypothetical protein
VIQRLSGDLTGREEEKNVSRSGLVGIGQDDSGLLGRSPVRAREEASGDKGQGQPCWGRGPVGNSYSVFQILNFAAAGRGAVIHSPHI